MTPRTLTAGNWVERARRRMSIPSQRVRSLILEDRQAIEQLQRAVFGTWDHLPGTGAYYDVTVTGATGGTFTFTVTHGADTYGPFTSDWDATPAEVQALVDVALDGWLVVGGEPGALELNPTVPIIDAVCVLTSDTLTGPDPSVSITERED